MNSIVKKFTIVTIICAVLVVFFLGFGAYYRYYTLNAEMDASNEEVNAWITGNDEAK